MRRPIVVAVASVGEARRFAARHALDYADVLHLAGSELPTRHGAFRIEAFATLAQPERRHLALVHGDLRAGTPVVHVRAACPWGERFGSLLCDCAVRLQQAMDEIAEARAGVLVYLRGDEDALAQPCGAFADDDAAAAILRALGIADENSTQPSWSGISGGDGRP